jgi:hypothetical protein
MALRNGQVSLLKGRGCGVKEWVDVLRRMRGGCDGNGIRVKGHFFMAWAQHNIPLS